MEPRNGYISKTQHRFLTRHMYNILADKNPYTADKIRSLLFTTIACSFTSFFSEIKENTFREPISLNFSVQKRIFLP